MASLNQTTIIQKLNAQGLRFFTTTDFKKFFDIKQDNTASKMLERLIKKGILKKLSAGRYLFVLLGADDFQIANFLYSPSYISLESALCFYGMLSQFPYQITSISRKKTKTITCLNKEFNYSHIKQSLFFGYQKEKGFLIASPEKALLDYLYFCSKGLGNFEKDDFNLAKINKQKLNELLSQASEARLTKIVKQLNLC
ncbi:hypothetical protein L6252_02700 [Candidatus Parcubacteria bacterium]|nr:hypothetical protein [Candidatus Parcubacteria bacterium]